MDDQIVICGIPTRLFGLAQQGRRIVTGQSDYILRPLFRLNQGENTAILEGQILPDDQDPTEVRKKNFFPWKQIELGKLDNPEILRRTKQFCWRKRRESHEEELQALVPTSFYDFLRDFESSSSDLSGTTDDQSRRWLSWLRSEQRAFRLARAIFSEDPEPTGKVAKFNSETWMREHGDEFRFEKWIKQNGKEVFEKLKEESVRLRCALLAPLGTAVDEAFNSAGRMLELVRFEVIYPRAIVYVEGFEPLSRSAESIRIISHAKKASYRGSGKLPPEPGELEASELRKGVRSIGQKTLKKKAKSRERYDHAKDARWLENWRSQQAGSPGLEYEDLARDMGVSTGDLVRALQRARQRERTLKRG